MNKIEINRLTGGTWRATMSLAPAFATAPGVSGGATAQGPWIDGEGDSPESALEHLQLRLGRVCMLNGSRDRMSDQMLTPWSPTVTCKHCKKVLDLPAIFLLPIRARLWRYEQTKMHLKASYLIQIRICTCGRQITLRESAMLGVEGAMA